MSITKKSIIDDVIMLASKSDVTDESRLDEDYVSYKIDLIRAQLIMAQYRVTNVLDRTWLQDLGLITFHKVNFADDPAVLYSKCDVSKAFIPQVITLESSDGNQDLGFNLLAANGTKYYPFALSKWINIPEEHERSKFPYFDRINNACYVNRTVTQLRAICVLQNPEDGKIISSTSIASGSIALGTVYRVKYGQVIYDGSAYQDGDTFTGTAVTTFGGNGSVYLNTQVIAFRESDTYPVTGDMARMIVIELLSKEYGIERMAIADVKNDSKDDAQKG